MGAAVEKAAATQGTRTGKNQGTTTATMQERTTRHHHGTTDWPVAMQGLCKRNGRRKQKGRQRHNEPEQGNNQGTTTVTPQERTTQDINGTG